MDTFHDCQRCHGRYLWLRVLGIEVCRDCGHKRKIKSAPEPLMERIEAVEMDVAALYAEIEALHTGDDT